MLSDEVSDVENGGGPGELVSGEVHRLRHTEDLGIVESGLVEVLESLSDEEEREKEPIDAAKNCFVLLGSLKEKK